MSEVTVHGRLSVAQAALLKQRFYEAIRHTSATLKDYRFSELRHGLEVEGFIVDDRTYQLRNDFVAPFLATATDPSYFDESGLAQIEISPPPMTITPGVFAEMTTDLRDRKRPVADAARRSGALFVQTALPPFLERAPEETPQHFNTGPLYELQVEFWQQHDARANISRFAYPVLSHEGDTVCQFYDNVLSLAFVSGIHSNFQPFDCDHAVRCFNSAQVLTPYLVALAANGDFLNAPLARSDYRLHIGMTSANLLDGDFHSDFGLYPFYLRSVEEYFYRQLLKTPIFELRCSGSTELENTIDSFRQTSWSFIQLKVVKGAIVIEFRPMSVQPSSELNVALHLYAVLLILYTAEHLPPTDCLPSIDALHQDLLAATLSGPSARLRWLDGYKTVREIFDLVTPELRRYAETHGFMPSDECAQICESVARKLNRFSPQVRPVDLFLERSHSDITFV